jgi:uncharacterized membrane protein YgdD (TMEM256/DUF423 family)
VPRSFFRAVGALSGFVGVAAGAFAAHALKARLSADLLQVFETGARYQMYHAFALLAAGWAGGDGECRPARWAGICFLLGTVLFSGSLYLLALTGIPRFGLVTPFGGVLFLAGWLFLAAAVRQRT